MLIVIVSTLTLGIQCLAPPLALYYQLLQLDFDAENIHLPLQDAISQISLLQMGW